MATFTGNVDTDAHILSLLKLADLNNICATNKFLKHVCHSKIITDKYNKAVKDAVAYVNKIVDKHYTIQTSEPFEVFLILMKITNILPDYYIIPKLVDNTSQLNIVIYPKDEITKVFPIVYYFYDEYDLIDTETYYGNKKNIINFLIHMYYDYLYDDIEIRDYEW
jgi:hypothetical protein